MKTAQRTEERIYDVVIQGGGMVGMTLAVALAREGMKVAMVERNRMQMQLEPQFDGRVSAIAYGSKCLLDSIGVWRFMAHEAEPIQDIRVSDGDTPFFLHFDHHDIGDEPFGYIVENRHTRYALQQAAGEYPNLHLLDGNAMERFERDDAGVTVYLHDGQVLRASLLVGADGKKSSVRMQAGIGAVEWNYKQTAIVCTIHHTDSHHGLAQERFLPAGPFAVLPMTPLENGLHRSSLVWVEPNDRVALYLELSEAEFVQEIEERVGDYLGTISAPGQRFSYPLSLMHAKTYVSQRLALVGDAAHGIHPIAGQGVNLGFRDVEALSQLLGERFQLGLDIGVAQTLARYERVRRFDNMTMLAVTDVLNRLFSNQLLTIKAARGAGLWLVGKVPELKKFFMRDAMGVAGKYRKIVNKK